MAKIETLIEFGQFIAEYLPQEYKESATVRFGTIGDGYLNVLVIHQNKIVSAGELAYQYWRSGLYNRAEYSPYVEKFKKELAVFCAAGFVGKIPVLYGNLDLMTL